MPKNQSCNAQATILSMVFMLGMVSAFSCLLANNARSESRQNVLMIFVDDLRPALGCYGDPIVKSPHIDRFASTARVFRKAYCHQSVCGPSRTSILTGKLPDNTGVWHNRNQFRAMHPELVTLPQWFMQNGYHTQSLGKVFSGDERELDPTSWSVSEVLKEQGWKNYALSRDKDSGKGLPFEYADVDDNGYSDGKLADLAVQKLAELKNKSNPFFLAVGFFKPHLPFNAPRKYWDLYDGQNFLTQTNRERTAGAPDFAYPDHLELAGYLGIPSDERTSPEQTRDLRHGYYACISYVDAQIGKVLHALEQQGLEKNTIVILLGDHGYSLGEAQHWCKDTNFELDTRVPLIIRVPGEKPGSSTSMIEYVDIYPTLSELAGLTIPANLDGKSFVPVLRDANHGHRDFVLSQFSRPFRSGNPELMGYSIRTKGYRYTRWIKWDTRDLLAEELYDYQSKSSVERDTCYEIETRNLVNEPQYTQTLTQLRQDMDTALSSRIKPVKWVQENRRPKKK
jgi:iduronate 2-sulfatase